MKNKGWKGDSYRHGLSARGIKNKTYEVMWNSHVAITTFVKAKNKDEAIEKAENESWGWDDIDELLTNDIVFVNEVKPKKKK